MDCKEAAAPVSEAELRQQSTALIVRSLTGDSEPLVKKPLTKAAEAELLAKSQDPTDRLCEMCKRLSSAREEAVAKADAFVVVVGPGSVADILSCFKELEKRPPSAVQLKSSGLGRELNERFWRKHPNADVSARCRSLLESWKVVVAQWNKGFGAGSGAAVAERAAAAKRQRDESKASSSQDTHGSGAAAASKEAASAARFAQAAEAAAWSKYCGAAEAVGKAEEGSERLRAYKQRIRLIGATFRRPENAKLRTRALEGKVSGGDLVECAEEELLSAERRAENKKVHEEALKLALAEKIELDLYDEHLECPLCSKTGAKYAVVCDTGMVPIDGSSGYKRQKTKKRIHAQCSSCGERWQHDDGWHV